LITGQETETDSQLIAKLIGLELDSGVSSADALKNVVEKKLMGTWKLAMVNLNNPSEVYLTKNSGDFILGKSNSEIIVTSDAQFFEDH
jgi:glucosamine 6-phosphate synthetase-like amidotransferase/phosphosugar isomerase protein